MITATSTMRIKLPELDFTKTFEECASKLIIPDMRYGINNNKGIDNQPFPPLEPSTIAAKTGARKAARKTGGLTKAGLAGSKTLVDTGALRESFTSKKIARNHIRINISEDREKIGYYLQVDGVGKKNKKFNFFGLSQRAELHCISKMKQALTNILRASNGR